jgi:hypothetical protein
VPCRSGGAQSPTSWRPRVLHEVDRTRALPISNTVLWLAANHVVVTRCLRFAGVYLGGHMFAGSCLDIVDRAETFVSDDRRKLEGDYRFGSPHHAAEDGRQ